METGVPSNFCLTLFLWPYSQLHINFRNPAVLRCFSKLTFLLSWVALIKSESIYPETLEKLIAMSKPSSLAFGACREFALQTYLRLPSSNGFFQGGIPISRNALSTLSIEKIHPKVNRELGNSSNSNLTCSFPRFHHQSRLQLDIPQHRPFPCL